VQVAAEAQKARAAEKEAQLAILREKVLSSQRASPVAKNGAEESKEQVKDAEATESANGTANGTAEEVAAAPSPLEPGETPSAPEDGEMTLVNGKTSQQDVPDITDGVSIVLWLELEIG
jgi:hypothetical protein